MKQMWMDRLVLVAVLIAAWQGASAAFGSYWISSPWLVVEKLWALAANGDLWFHTRFTLGEAVAGFFLGALPACAVALCLRRMPRLESAVAMLASVGYATPKTALVPLFILWFGVGPAAKVALVASAIFFIVFYSTLRGVKAIDPRMVLSMQVLGASEWQLLSRVVLPSVLPYLFGGLRVAVPYAVAGAIVGEIISSNRGLGYLAQYGAMDFDTTLTFAALAAVVVIVVTINASMGLLQRRLMRWQSEDLSGQGAIGA